VTAKTKPLSTGAIGKLLRVDRTTVWGWIRSGKLPAERTIGGQYRVDREALARLLREKGMPIPPEIADDHPRRILIADDDPVVLGFLEAVLTRNSSDFEVVTASNGFAAGKMVSSFRPHVVVIDIHMPGLGGLDVCEDIKRDKATRDIKIIIVTGYPTRENVERARKIGVEKLLEKPIEAKAFLDAVHEALR
jgi:excisionase family DNA binding protein